MAPRQTSPLSAVGLAFELLGALYRLRMVLLLMGAGWLFLVLVEAWAERQQVSFDEALYLAAITSLTVGYGDFAPHSGLGRLAAIGLGVIGVLSAGVFVAATIKAIEGEMRNESNRGRGADGGE